MARSSALAKRLAKLSPEKRALLEKRLGRAKQVEAEGPRAAARAGIDRDALAKLLEQPAVPLVDDDLWQKMVEAGLRQAKASDSTEGLKREASLEPKLNGHAAAYICVALERLGAFREAGERYTLEELREHCSILPDYHKALRRWLVTLAEDGLLRIDGETYSNPTALPPEDLEISDDDRRHYGENLSAIMTGGRHPLEFLVPGGSTKGLEENYTRSPTFQYCNGVSSEILGTAVEQLPADRRMRCLEIGAGTGGTSVSLLPVLPKDRSVYVFTDVSRLFVDLGREKFAEYPFLVCDELDIEKDPLEQGYQRHAYDWIVAAHVLHATRNLHETLEHVCSLLAPGGMLLLLEETRFLRKFNFSMGFLPGFDHFEDYDLRPLHPLLDSESWGKLLLANGFSDFATMTDPEALPQVLGVDVMLARKAL